MIKVKDEPDLARDSNGVIQNINTNAYHEYIARRQKLTADADRLTALEKDNVEIKNSLAQILKLLMGEKWTEYNQETN